MGPFPAAPWCYWTLSVGAPRAWGSPRSVQAAEHAARGRAGLDHRRGLVAAGTGTPPGRGWHRAGGLPRAAERPAARRRSGAHPGRGEAPRAAGYRGVAVHVAKGLAGAVRAAAGQRPGHTAEDGVAGRRLAGHARVAARGSVRAGPIGVAAIAGA